MSLLWTKGSSPLSGTQPSCWGTGLHLPHSNMLRQQTTPAGVVGGPVQCDSEVEWGPGTADQEDTNTPLSSSEVFTYSPHLYVATHCRACTKVSSFCGSHAQSCSRALASIDTSDAHTCTQAHTHTHTHTHTPPLHCSTDLSYFLHLIASYRGHSLGGHEVTSSTTSSSNTDLHNCFIDCPLQQTHILSSPCMG